jgi:hypothetical protein
MCLVLMWTPVDSIKGKTFVEIEESACAIPIPVEVDFLRLPVLPPLETVTQEDLRLATEQAARFKIVEHRVLDALMVLRDSLNRDNFTPPWKSNGSA